MSLKFPGGSIGAGSTTPSFPRRASTRLIALINDGASTDIPERWRMRGCFLQLGSGLYLWPLVALLARPGGCPAVAGEVPLPAPVGVHHPEACQAVDDDFPPVRRPTVERSVLRQATQSASVGVDDVDDVVVVERDPPSVRRPGRGYRYPSVAGVGEPGRYGMLRSSVRVHDDDPDLPRRTGSAAEGDVMPVGRPGEAELASLRRVRQVPLRASIRVHDVD